MCAADDKWECRAGRKTSSNLLIERYGIFRSALPPTGFPAGGMRFPLPRGWRGMQVSGIKKALKNEMPRVSSRVEPAGRLQNRPRVKESRVRAASRPRRIAETAIQITCTCHSFRSQTPPPVPGTECASASASGAPLCTAVIVRIGPHGMPNTGAPKNDRGRRAASEFARRIPARRGAGHGRPHFKENPSNHRTPSNLQACFKMGMDAIH